MLRLVAKDYEKQYARAAKIITNTFYVNDCLTGAATSEEAKEIWEELAFVLRLAGMWLQKWRSNETGLIKSIPMKMNSIKLLPLHQNASKQLVYIGTPKKTIFKSLLLDSLQKTILPKERLPQISPGLSISCSGSLLLQF